MNLKLNMKDISKGTLPFLVLTHLPEARDK
jgi:hypothetical protein